MKALVTGGGGFLGRYIVEQILDAATRRQYSHEAIIPNCKRSEQQ
jgi:nucleoside-diphosphate-sugar epimerase